MVLGYQLSDHRAARVLLNYKAWGSEWQRDGCDRWSVTADEHVMSGGHRAVPAHQESRATTQS